MDLCGSKLRYQHFMLLYLLLMELTEQYAARIKNNIKTALDKWIKGAGPFSYHTLDMNRFYNLVYECIREDYILTYEDIADALKEHTKLIDTKVHEKSEKFEKRAGAIRYFVAFLKEKKEIDIELML